MDQHPRHYATASLRLGTMQEGCISACSVAGTKAVDILHSIPIEEIYKHIVRGLEGHYGDH
jgi:hypothetical protein